MTSFRSFNDLLIPVLVALQAAAVVAFIEFLRRADAAMDKSGLGSYHAFAVWAERASWAFWIFAGLWVATAAVLVARYGRGLFGKQLLSQPGLALWLVPTCGAVGWVVSMMWV